MTFETWRVTIFFIFLLLKSYRLHLCFFVVVFLLLLLFCCFFLFVFFFFFFLKIMKLSNDRGTEVRARSEIFH